MRLGCTLGGSPGIFGVTFPPSEPGRHGWAELLTLVDAIRAIAFDRSLDDRDIARRIRDAFVDYDRA
jgi:hypothetical protein